MNTPIDPREGDRRQKALRARLAALAQRNKAMIGKLGQDRGRVRSVGAIGGARFAQNGAARPGALSFLQPRGPGRFGLNPVRPVGGPQMNPVFGGAPPRHVSNPLPSAPLEGGIRGPEPQMTNQALPPNMQIEGIAPDAPVISSIPDTPQTISAPQQSGMIQGTAPDTSFLNTVGPSGLIPLGGGRYLNLSTGQIHGIADSGAGSGRSFAV